LVTASIGIAMFGRVIIKPEDILRDADGCHVPRRATADTLFFTAQCMTRSSRAQLEITLRRAVEGLNQHPNFVFTINQSCCSSGAD